MCQSASGRRLTVPSLVFQGKVSVEVSLLEEVYRCVVQVCCEGVLKKIKRGAEKSESREMRSRWKEGAR